MQISTNFYKTNIGRMVPENFNCVKENECPGKFTPKNMRDESLTIRKRSYELCSSDMNKRQKEHYGKQEDCRNSW